MDSKTDNDRNKKIIIDLDNTITFDDDNVDYYNKKPNLEVIEKCKIYREKGFQIVIFTSRNMRTYSGNISKIKSETLPVIIDWLEKYDFPYDEIILGKPWCGKNGFYVDDKAIRPNEFVKNTYEEILKLIT